MTELDKSTISEKACKLLGTQRTYKEGMLFKRQRGLHGNQKKLKFQERFCRLTSHSLDYFDTNPKKRDLPKGQFDVQRIRLIESMPSDIFGKECSILFPFQVGDNSEVMYFCSKTATEREEWVVAFCKASRDKGTRMLTHYHKGIFGLNLKGRWGCCGSPQRAAPGCSPVPDKQMPPMTPPLHKTMSIQTDIFSGGGGSGVRGGGGVGGGKPRSDTFADFTMAGGGGGVGEVCGSWTDGGFTCDGGDREKISGSESPQESPLIRSFTLTVPVRSKPDPKKYREASGRRGTVDFDHYDNNRRDFEPLKEIEEVRGGRAGQAWSSDMEKEEGKRASSPSPSEDSGKGTSTGSSRPSSQVISGDTEEGMRPGRSWSLGKNNVLSPLTDQVAPAPAPLGVVVGSGNREGTARGPTPSEETDGVEVEGEVVLMRPPPPHQDPEDTLKDTQRAQRNMSSPPEIGGGSEEEDGEDDEGDDMVHPLGSSMQDRNIMRTSRSMDAISKRDSVQLPPSPLVNVRRFNYPETPTPTNSTPTHSTHRLSKVSNTSNSSSSPQLKHRSMMLPSGIGMDRPDGTLRRRRTIEEYSPLHRACRDGNVAALWDMLNGSVLADLEDLSSSTSIYTPLFFAFLNDHYQAMECLLDHGADPSATEPINKAPVLHLACEKGCSDMVDLLLGYNVDVNQVDARGNTALWQACRNGHHEIVETLILRGARVDTEGDNQRTPLHEAASSGHASIVEVLLEEGGANPCPRDHQYATPYDLAYNEGHEEVMEVLQRHIPDEVRPYTLLHTYTPSRHLMVTSLVFTNSSTLVSGSRDCHATFWDMSENELNVKQRVRQQDSVLGVEKWAEHLVVSSTFVTLNSLGDSAHRRIVADDSLEDESLTNPPLHFASFGAEGLLATASVEGHVVKVWPPMSPKAGLPVQPQARLAIGVSKDTPDPGIIHSLSVSRSPEHPWIAVGLQPGTLFQPQGNKTVHLYNWREGRVHQIFDAGRGGLSVTVHTEFSPCGRQLAVGCHENICIWEPETGDLLYKFTTKKKVAVTGLSYTPNGAHLAVGLESGEVQVFDIESSNSIFTLQPHHEYPSPSCALAYTEDGQLLAVGHRNGQIQIWRAYAGTTSQEEL